MKEVLAIGAMLLLAISLTIGYNLYSDSKKRDMYKLCLETSTTNDKLNYCSLGR